MNKDVQADLRRLANGCIEQCLQLRFKKDKETMLEHLDKVQRCLDEIRELVEGVVGCTGRRD